MITAFKKSDDNTITFSITIPFAFVKKTREEVLEELTKQTNLPGFRKGKAPKKLVEGKIDPEKVHEETLKKLLPKAYIQAVEEHKIRPVINPKIQITKMKDNEDWQFDAITCEAPVIDLKNYKEAVKSITAKSKIVIPGKETTPPNFDEIIKALLEAVSATIPGILVEQEMQRFLSQTLDEVKQLGLTLDQYLSSTGRTTETLQEEARKRAENEIKIEFVLSKVADSENIAVEEKEIEEAIQKAKDPKERENLERNRYVLASILRQQKTLDFLKNL